MAVSAVSVRLSEKRGGRLGGLYWKVDQRLIARGLGL
jgi:hypothetical protein